MKVLVVDTQQLIMNADLYQFALLKRQIVSLLQVARNSGIEVIYTRHDDGEGEELSKGTTGYEIYDEFKPIKGERIFDKTVNSAFKESGLLEYLRESKEDTLMVVGLQTDYCIDAIVKCGFEHGFHIIVPANCNSTVDNAFMSAKQTYQYYNEFIWNGRYADCIPFEAAIELMRS